MPNLTVIDGGLAKSGRPRRTVLPDLQELRRGLHKPSVRCLRLGNLDVEVRREPFMSMGGEERDQTVNRRETLCILSRNEQEIGCLLFVEFQPPVCCPNVQLWDALDGYSLDDAHLAETILEGWEWIGPDVLDYGNLVELRLVGLWAPVLHGPQLVNELVAKLFPKHSILVVQATPLNPRDPNRSEDWDLDRRQARQRAALMRMCERLLGFAPFPSAEAAGDGWMWRLRESLRGVVKPPATVPVSPGVWMR